MNDRAPVSVLRSLEGLRLVASLGVVSLHMLPHVGLGTAWGVDLFVDMFFVVSGVVIGALYTGLIRSPRDYGNFLRRRLARIYPLHLATLLFYVALGTLMSAHGMHSSAKRFDRDQILPNLLLIHAWGPRPHVSFNFPSWSISAEWCLYLIFPALAMVAGHSRRGPFAVALLLAVSISLGHLVGTPFYRLTFALAVFRAAPSFAFGIWLAAVAPSLAARAVAGRAGAALLCLTAALAAESWTAAPYPLILATLWALVAAAYACDLRGLATWLSWRPLSDRGHLTYSLYLLHVPVTTVFLSFLFPRLLGTGQAAGWLSLVGSLVILYGLSEFSFRRFEDPLRRRLR